jgi:hypothetical protein
MVVSEADLERANARMAAKRSGPVAVAARYDRGRGRIVVRLSTGLELAFPPRAMEGLSAASAADLGRIEITPSGLGLHWPALDADVYLPALLDGIFGSKRWASAPLGATGESARSPMVAAGRGKGKPGGRPRRKAAST